MIVIYFPSSLILANYTFKHFGVFVSIILGSILNCLCLLTRTLINWNFLVAMGGAFFYGVAQPLFFNASPEIATNWFDSDEVFAYYKQM